MEQKKKIHIRVASVHSHSPVCDGKKNVCDGKKNDRMGIMREKERKRDRDYEHEFGKKD